MKSLVLNVNGRTLSYLRRFCVPTSEQEVCLLNCNDYVKVSKINDISVNSTVHDDCLLKRINIGIVKAPITFSLSSLKKGQLLCSSDFLKPLLVTSAHTHI